jgi:hypothetical protein
MPVARHAVDPLTEVYTAEVARTILNMSMDLFYEEIAKGRLRIIKRGRLTMVRRTAINAYLDMVEAESYDSEGRVKKDLGLEGKGKWAKKIEVAE